MTRSTRLATAVAVAMLGSTTLSWTPAVQAQEQQEQKITTKEVAKAMQAAQEAVNKKQWDQALASIKQAQAVEKKTPFEAFKIDEFMGFVLIQQKNYAATAPVFERVVNSGMLPADQVDARLKAVAQLYFQLKQYDKAVEYAKRWLKNNPGDQDMSVLVAQGHYLLNDYKNAIAAMNDVISRAEKAGQTPKENWLQIVLSSHYKMENDEGVTDTLVRVVKHYPTAENWDKVLDAVRRQDLTDRVKLSLYRLMADVNVLKTPNHIVDAAEISLDVGLPGDALQFLEQGFASKALEGGDKARNERLLANAKKQVQADRAALPQFAKEAQSGQSGQGLVALGQAYLSYGQFAEAAQALQAGIKKGGVNDADEAQVNLGIALLKSKQAGEARAALKAVPDASKWKDVADLWLVRATQPAA